MSFLGSRRRNLGGRFDPIVIVIQKCPIRYVAKLGRTIVLDVVPWVLYLLPTLR